MASALQRAFRLLSKFHDTIFNSFIPPFPKDALQLAAINLPNCGLENNHKPRQVNLIELLKSTVLWAVPKRRKSIEKRRTKRFGCLRYVYKMLLPKTNILICTKCGSYHEAGVLCAKCYQRIKDETELMQEKIEQHLGISPVEEEVVVLYEDDNRSNNEFFEGKRIVEMNKPRPKIFSNNLLQKSTEVKSASTDVSVTSEPLK
ncbi:hypothetical protein RUM43_000653 [Polyplax serrata]|uniref:Large ribosomal subunit protein bL32m n=1 Tax=Polyplax serrata TaxID=468196 RepID=A0AAN8SGI6_POLSC